MATKSKKEGSKKPRCEKCGGTGLRPDDQHVTAICECAAGARRNAAACWD